MRSPPQKRQSVPAKAGPWSNQGAIKIDVLRGMRPGLGLGIMGDGVEGGVRAGTYKAGAGPVLDRHTNKYLH